MKTSIVDRFPAVLLLAWRPHLTVLALAVTVAITAASRVWGGAAGAVVLAGAVPAVLRRRPAPSRASSADDVVVLVLNVWHGRADPAALAALVGRAKPDLVVLPEAGHDYLGRILELVPGYHGVASLPAGRRDGWGVTVLAGPRAADVTMERGHQMRLPHLRVTGGLLGDRVLYAVHTTAPARLGVVHDWRRDLRTAAAWTAEGAIVAGDLNATVDHRLLRAAGRSAGPTGAGTWPARLPRWAGIRIDHVLLPDGVGSTGASVHDVPGSDHRAVLARVRL
ncbi:endonuclease/exonuclease/phosphatase family protein [Pseudonocardia abyssalis]|uniref:Endonuclease/exonuclease/phosphatase family protein n=1 Tax=Pseudonocardia abyssalis TaxID=2792008 RepID=A0ABS6UZF9_9PSEU|nr:endonuclease/exonuclease/phosphatase family protein [Pseudonocardia abyssalis]MBW0116531.1 endonuclease/exonuclease/phosphatase family protein [Pseudonocardia abyssalis]MBW0137628.1 endonuclease/exonuclease/phosphatase family protein [Pseudonocardia abyssalis]